MSVVFLFVPVSIFASINSKPSEYSHGLTFRSHEVNKDARTSLRIPFDSQLKIGSGIKLEFEMKHRQVEGSDSFGYIFRMITSANSSIDMLLVRGKNINFVLNNEERQISSTKLKDKITKGEWLKVTIAIKDQSTACTIDGETVTLNQPLGGIAAILFGVNNHPTFFTVDLPPMTLRNLMITKDNGTIIKHWKLDKHLNNITYDMIDQSPAMVKNGIWEIDNHVKWKRVHTLKVDNEYAQIAIDSVRGRIFMTTNDSLYIQDLNTSKVTRDKVNEGNPYRSTSSHMIYDYRTQELISYFNDSFQVLKYDFNAHVWSGSPDTLALQIQHHNRYIDPETNSLVLFGGYGMYRYNALLHIYNMDTHTWEITDLKDIIAPRYLSSLGYLGDGRALLLGGHGNHTGRQESGTANFYDLYELDTRNKEYKKLGELPIPDAPYTFSNSMVIDRSQHKAYTLGYKNRAYKTGLRLFEIDYETLEYRIMQDSIPYNFFDTESYCDLFLFKNKELYAVLRQKDQEGYTISTYSLLYPPLSEQDVQQVINNSGDRLQKNILWIVVTLITAIGGIGYFWLYRKREKRKPIAIDEPEINSDEVQHITDEEIPEIVRDDTSKKSQISLLGGFQVFDQEGNDITNEFTPIMRQIFSLVLLKSIHTGKGIKSERLHDIFWFDLDKSKASNNRSVNFRKLRLVLEKVGDVSINNTNSYWAVGLGSLVCCDYKQCLSLLDKIKEENDPESVKQLIQLSGVGTLLPDINAEWLDKYKSEFSDKLIGVLTAYMNHVKDDMRLSVNVANVILLHDPIDEFAITIKCSNLYKLGHKGLSKQAFDKYQEEYIRLLNEAPTIRYEAIISEL